jgi:DNA-binding NtrC family response regulator
MSDSRKKVLIVDDEPAIRDSLKLLLKGNFDVSLAEDGQQALGMLEQLSPDLILLDVLMPNLDGLAALRALRERVPQVPVIMLTATNTVKTAVQAMKWGAVDYLNKPFDIEELTSLIVSTLDASEQAATSLFGQPGSSPQEPESARGLAQISADFGPLVGRASCMQGLFSKIQQVAARDSTVLISGESGTGKELVARRIHELSPRSGKPFIAINCAAIPETLIESELFGHEKGAFTHAVERRLGHFEMADGGTLLLDEIGELSLNVQVKMLRVLQEQEFYRVGRSKSIRVDVRIIAATNRNLEELIKEKKFRQDLFYRINVISLTLPPLRDRYDDIPNLVDFFSRRFAPLYGDRMLNFGAEAMQCMVQYDWPGNVRELENVVESLLALCPNEEIGVDDLPRKLRNPNAQASASAEEFRLTLGNSTLKFDDAERIFESEMIIKALKRTNYVQTRAAELLGISRRILKYKMDKLGICETAAGTESSAVEQGAAAESEGSVSEESVQEKVP